MTKTDVSKFGRKFATKTNKYDMIWQAINLDKQFGKQGHVSAKNLHIYNVQQRVLNRNNATTEKIIKKTTA